MEINSIICLFLAVQITERFFYNSKNHYYKMPYVFH